jgi:hypothetical protein
MKCLSNRAETIFRQLIEGLTAPGDHRKIENTGGTFMAVNIDVLSVERRSVSGREWYEMRVALAHNYEQNGDLMADPDVEFLVTPLGVVPLTFQQDPGIYRRWAWRENGQWRFFQRGQADLTAFCNQWMQNIKHQQWDERQRTFLPTAAVGEQLQSPVRESDGTP